MKQVIRSIRDYCIHRYENIAVAETITSGCLQMLLGNVEKAGAYFQGGITAFTPGQLQDQLGVVAADARKGIIANMATTIEMARKVAARFRSEIGIAVNGGMEEDGIFKPAYVAIVRFNKVIYAEKLMPAARAASAVPIEYAQRVIQTLADKLSHDPEEIVFTTSEVPEPLS